MAKKRKLGGVGAVGKAKMKSLHPSEPLRIKYGTGYERDYLDALEILRSDKGKVSARGKIVDRYFVRHPFFPDIEFKVGRRNFTVEDEAATPFEDEVAQDYVPTAEVVTEPQGDGVDVDSGPRPPQGRHLTTMEIDELRAEGHTVDDDNEPVEENVDDPGPPPVGQWMKPTTCPRIREGNQKVKGRWINFRWDQVAEMDELELFLLSFPIDYIRDVVLPETNKNIANPVDMREFFRFLGCLLFIACHPGVGDRDLWWSNKPISPRDGAPFRLNAYMSKNRFKDIMNAIRYTNKEQPEYHDKFHDVRQMQDAWNDHMTAHYFSGWWNCLDESMQMSLNPYVPGWMVVPRKPTPFGNEYHTICDGELGYDRDRGNPIMWHVELQEGKDRPPQLGPKEYNVGGKSPTVGLMLRMHKAIARQGKACTMDSGFCVSSGIVQLEAKLGVYAQALIKKRGKHWPKGIPGNQIDEYFDGKPIGHCETLKVEWEGKNLYIHCMKEEKYVTKFMSTFGTLDEVTAKKARRTPKNAPPVEFYYPEPVAWHNQSKHWVDDHNQRRQAPIDLADCWKTQWWPHRQFAFFLAISETNAANSRARAKGDLAEPQLQFRKALAFCMLENTLNDAGVIVRQVERCLRTRDAVLAEHVLVTRPDKSGRWLGTRWSKTKQVHQKSHCHGCNFRMRTYCTCNKAVPMCFRCHVKHVLDVNN